MPRNYIIIFCPGQIFFIPLKLRLSDEKMGIVTVTRIHLLHSVVRKRKKFEPGKCWNSRHRDNPCRIQNVDVIERETPLVTLNL